MRYDLITAINSMLAKKETTDKKKQQLTNQQEKLIRLLQDQALPELDGLRCFEIEKIEPDSGWCYDISLVTRQNQIFSLYLNDDGLTIIDNRKGDFALSISVIKKEEKTKEEEKETKEHEEKDKDEYLYFCAYVQGSDVIFFEKRPADEIKDKEVYGKYVVHAEFYINVHDELTEVPVPKTFGRPNDLIPDFEEFIGQEKDGTYYLKIMKPDWIKMENDETMIFNKWRRACNQYAIEYRQKRFDALKPSK